MKRTMLYLSLLAVSCSVSAAKYPVLTESSPEKAGFNVERLNQMDRWISQQVDVGYPSVNLLIIKDNQIVYRKAWGAAKKYDGIMLPNHAPLVIAEQFGTLESLYPGRIDLGLGRAPVYACRSRIRALASGSRSTIGCSTRSTVPWARVRLAPGRGCRS